MKRKKHMNEIKEILIKKGIITDEFDYQDLDIELINTYKYFEKRFQELYQWNADRFHLDNCVFYICKDYKCNAHAVRMKNHNIIKITNGYPFFMKDKFDDKLFRNIIFICFINEKSVSDAYCDLYEDQNFEFNKFALNCSIQFTFSHEFQHILQFNSQKIRGDFLYSENLDKSSFSLKKHAWEFDADRMASFEVLKYAYSVYSELKYKNNEKLTCILYIALASIVITKNLFYFGVMDPVSQKYVFNKQDFYTKQFSHPHPLVRIHNIIDYFYDSIPDYLPMIKIDIQQLFNNVIGISKLYFDRLLPSQNVMQSYFQDLDKFLDIINDYNGEIYDFTVKDKSITRLLKKRGIKF
jgi:hypothetical protein